MIAILEKSMDEKLLEIATTVFGLADGEVTMACAPSNTKNWDSLRHMRLILEVESQFDIEMDEGEITDVVDMKSLAATIAKHTS